MNTLASLPRGYATGPPRCPSSFSSIYAIDELLFGCFGDRVWICNQAGLELQVSLLLLPKCWKWRCMPSHLLEVGWGGMIRMLYPCPHICGAETGLFLLCWVSEPSADPDNALGFLCRFSVLRMPGRFQKLSEGAHQGV